MSHPKQPLSPHYRRRRCPPVQTQSMEHSTMTPPASPPVRVRIASADDTVYTNMLTNMSQLLRDAQQTDDASSPTTTSALLAKKALQYRKMFARAQAVDVDDPSFDVASFMGVARATTQVTTEAKRGDTCECVE